MSSRRVEWPPGSGRVATYSDAEREVMNSLRRQAERGEITVAELRRQVAVFHDIKIEFNATMIEEGERPMEMPMEMPEQSSLFPIPEKVQRMIEGQTKEGQ